MHGINRNSGYISLLILLVLFFLSWGGIQAYLKVSAQERIAIYEAQKTRAGYIADNGLEWARDCLAKDSSWRGGTKQFSAGKVKVGVVQNNQVYQITSQAEDGIIRQSRMGEIAQGNDGRFILIKYRWSYD